MPKLAAAFCVNKAGCLRVSAGWRQLVGSVQKSRFPWWFPVLDAKGWMLKAVSADVFG